MNYRLYHLAAEHVLIKTLPSNYDDAWLESNVRDEYKGLTVRQIEDKIQELYRILQVAFEMGRNFQIAEEERRFHAENGVEYTNDEVQELWATNYEGAR